MIERMLGTPLSEVLGTPHVQGYGRGQTLSVPTSVDKMLVFFGFRGISVPQMGDRVADTLGVAWT